MAPFFGVAVSRRPVWESSYYWDQDSVEPLPIRFQFGMVAVDHDRDGIDQPFRDGIQDFASEIADLSWSPND